MGELVVFSGLLVGHLMILDHGDAQLFGCLSGALALRELADLDLGEVALDGFLDEGCAACIVGGRSNGNVRCERKATRHAVSDHRVRLCLGLEDAAAESALRWSSK